MGRLLFRTNILDEKWHKTSIEDVKERGSLTCPYKIASKKWWHWWAQNIIDGIDWTDDTCTRLWRIKPPLQRMLDRIIGVQIHHHYKDGFGLNLLRGEEPELLYTTESNTRICIECGELMQTCETCMPETFLCDGCYVEEDIR